MKNIVVEKHTNKEDSLRTHTESAESAERRALAARKLGHQRASVTQGTEQALTGLARLRNAAKRHCEVLRFNNLLHYTRPSYRHRPAIHYRPTH
jgi:hypothetical protein